MLSISVTESLEHHTVETRANHCILLGDLEAKLLLYSAGDRVINTLRSLRAHRSYAG